jgi:hypothetical protein
MCWLVISLVSTVGSRFSRALGLKTPREKRNLRIIFSVFFFFCGMARRPIRVVEQFTFILGATLQMCETAKYNPQKARDDHKFL